MDSFYIWDIVEQDSLDERSSIKYVHVFSRIV